MDTRRFVAEFEAYADRGEGTSCAKTCDTLKKALYDEGHSPVMYLSLSGASSLVNRKNNHFVLADGTSSIGVDSRNCRRFLWQVLLNCRGLSRVIFRASSSLMLLGSEAFRGSRLGEIQIPGSVKELSDKCFYMYLKLSRVTFGESSSLRRLGIDVFRWCANLEEFLIPESVEEVCDAFASAGGFHV